MVPKDTGPTLPPHMVEISVRSEQVQVGLSLNSARKTSTIAYIEGRSAIAELEPNLTLDDRNLENYVELTWQLEPHPIEAYEAFSLTLTQKLPVTVPEIETLATLQIGAAKASFHLRCKFEKKNQPKLPNIQFFPYDSDVDFDGVEFFADEAHRFGRIYLQPHIDDRGHQFERPLAIEIGFAELEPAWVGVSFASDDSERTLLPFDYEGKEDVDVEVYIRAKSRHILDTPFPLSGQVLISSLAGSERSVASFDLKALIRPRPIENEQQYSEIAADRSKNLLTFRAIDQSPRIDEEYRIDPSSMGETPSVRDLYVRLREAETTPVELFRLEFDPTSWVGSICVVPSREEFAQYFAANHATLSATRKTIVTCKGKAIGSWAQLAHAPQSVTMQLLLEDAHGQHEAAQWQLEVQLAAQSQRYVAIDFGASAVAVVTAGNERDENEGYSTVKMGKILDTIDRDRMDQSDALIASIAGVSRKGWWRGRYLPQSQLTASNPARLEDFLDTRRVARSASPLQRYSVSVPVVPNSALWHSEVRVMTAPKMQILANPFDGSQDDLGIGSLTGADVLERVGGEVAPVDRKLDRTALLKDIFFEIGQSYIFGEDLDACRHARLILTKPCLFSREQSEILTDASQGFAHAVGAGSDPPILVPEPVAAALYVCEKRMRRNPPVSGDKRILCYDLGAGTLDIVALEGRWSQTKCQFTSFREVASIGIPLGGNYIDQTLAVIANMELIAIVGRRHVRDIMFHPDNERDRMDYREAAVRLANDIQSAKIELGRSNSANLEIRVGRPGGSGDRWLYRDTNLGSSTRSADGRATLKIAKIDDGESLAERGDDVFVLSLTPEAFGTRGKMGWLMELMTKELFGNFIKKLRDDVWPSDFRCDEFVVTGRASLWPPLRHKLEDLIEKSEFSQHFAKGSMAKQETDPSELKLAVSCGAFKWASRQSFVDEYRADDQDNHALLFGLRITELGNKPYDVHVSESQPVSLEQGVKFRVIFSCLGSTLFEQSDDDARNWARQLLLLPGSGNIAMQDGGEATIQREGDMREIVIRDGQTYYRFRTSNAQLPPSLASGWPYSGRALEQEAWWHMTMPYGHR